MDLTESSETSAKLNLTPGKYPKENIQVSEHGENLKSSNVYVLARDIHRCLTWFPRDTQQMPRLQVISPQIL
jgi:hypothetical protein